MLRFLGLVLCLFASPSWATDPQLKSELERLRETYWEAMTGDHWIRWDHVASNENTKVLGSIPPTAQMLGRMFGADDPEAAALLANLRALPTERRKGILELLYHREVLVEGYKKLDDFLSSREGRQNPEWRSSAFGREVLRLSERMFENYYHLDKPIDVLKKAMTEWRTEAETLARLSPYPDLTDILNSLAAYAGAYLPGGKMRDYHERMKNTLDLLRTLVNAFDTGWTDCERTLDDNLKLTAKRPALGKPALKLLTAPRR